MNWTTAHTRGFLKHASRVAAVVLAIAFIVLVWERGLDERTTSKNLGEVEPGFYRSGQISQHMIGPTLSKLDIDTVISLSPDNPDNADNMAEYNAAKSLGLERYHVQLRGNGTGNPDEYVKALAHLIEAKQHGHTVLVHCSAGSERTGGLVALYRTLFLGMPADEAVVEMAEFKHDADENSPLIAYLNENVEYIAGELVRLGVLPAVPETLPHFEPL